MIRPLGRAFPEVSEPGSGEAAGGRGGDRKSTRTAPLLSIIAARGERRKSVSC